MAKDDAGAAQKYPGASGATETSISLAGSGGADLAGVKSIL